MVCWAWRETWDGLSLWARLWVTPPRMGVVRARPPWRGRGPEQPVAARNRRARRTGGNGGNRGEGNTKGSEAVGAVGSFISFLVFGIRFLSSLCIGVTNLVFRAGPGGRSSSRCGQPGNGSRREGRTRPDVLAVAGSCIWFLVFGIRFLS